MSDARAPLNPNDWRQDSGPLAVYLADASVTEIMVNGPSRIFIERNGVVQETSTRFDSTEALMKLLNSIVVAAGKELNRKNAYVDARLPDGSRVNIVIPPISVDGPILTIRKFAPKALNYSHLISGGALDEKMLYFINQIVLAKLNIVVCGGTGSGKTTLLNAISAFIPVHERVITIEDTAELKLGIKNLVRLETRPARAGGDTGVTTQELITNALRMRPDRILIGECRGPEAWDMLVAMNTGHEGSMTTLHANSAYDSLRRLEAMILRADMGIPVPVIRQDICETIDMVVQAERCADGKRRVVEIIEVLGQGSDGTIATQELFRYDVQKGFHSTGVEPRFLKERGRAAVHFPKDFFDPASRIRLAA